MSTTTASPAQISPAALAERVLAGDAVTLLDVREDASWTIEAPAVASLHVPAPAALADPAALARDLDGPVVVVCNKGITAERVAQALAAAGADATVLAGGMRGWIGLLRAVRVELDVPGLEIRQIQRPGRGCLSYLVAAGDRALVVDPAPDTDAYLALADEMGVRIAAVVDTHLHADHLSGARELARRAAARLYLPAPALDRGVTYAGEVLPLVDGDALDLGGIPIRAIALPGHTTDMTGLLVGERALIGGDSLFVDGIARPDLQQGDPDGARAMARMLHRTLHERVLSLADDVVLLPGHTHPGLHSEAIAATLGDVRRAVPELAIDDPAAFAEELLADMPPRPANYESVIAVNAGQHPYDPDLEAGGNSCSTR